MFEKGSTNPGTNCMRSDWNKFYTMLLAYRSQIDWDEMKNKVVSTVHNLSKINEYFPLILKDIFSSNEQKQATDLKRIALRRIICEIAKNVFDGKIEK